MRKTKLPTAYKKTQKCRSCGAAIIHSYDYENGLYQWKCQGCGAVRYDSGIRFETRFQTAAEIGK